MAGPTGCGEAMDKKYFPQDWIIISEFGWENDYLCGNICFSGCLQTKEEKEGRKKDKKDFILTE